MDYQIFPGGRRKAVTFGFDDGEIHDRRLAEMLRQYGLKATFFLVSGQMGLTVDPFFRYGRNTRVERVNGGELPLTYAGMEIASHTRFHRLPQTVWRRRWENPCGSWKNSAVSR